MPVTGMPPVSVFMTVRNEERDLADCVERILDQDYAGELEPGVRVGPSADRPRESAAARAAEHPTFPVVDNPTASPRTGSTPRSRQPATTSSSVRTGTPSSRRTT